jgi:hypothetical protein
MLPVFRRKACLVYKVLLAMTAWNVRESRSHQTLLQQTTVKNAVSTSLTKNHHVYCE